MQHNIEALRSRLTQEYEQRIEEALENAKQTAARIEQEICATMQEQAERTKQAAEQQLATEQNEHLARTRQQVSLLRDEAEKIATQRVFLRIQELAHELDVSKRKRILISMKEQLQQDIAQVNMTATDKSFMWECHKHTKIPGCKATLDVLGIRASTKDIAFEASIESLIKEQYAHIRKTVVLEMEAIR